MSDDRVTTGEIYRICLAIQDAVKEQNGRVRKLEQDNVRLKAYWTSGVLAAGFMGDWLKHKMFGG